MKLYGRMKVDDSEFIAILETTNAYSRIYLLDKYHVEDRKNLVLGRPLQFPVYDDLYRLEDQDIDKGYIIAAYRRTIKSGETGYYGNINLVHKFIELQGYANTYMFKKENIVYDETVKRDIFKDKATTKLDLNSTISTIQTEVRFKAADANCYVEYEKVNNTYKRLRVAHKNIQISLDIMNINRTSIKLERDAYDYGDRNIKKLSSIANLKDLTLEDLEAVLNLSWLEGKDYRAIQTKEDFEKYVMKDILEEYYKCVERGEELLLSLDTETDGLNMCYLSEDNPDKNHICATPLAWRDDQAVVVFNDMAYHDNLDRHYMFSRLRDLLEDNEEITVHLRQVKDGEVIKEKLINNKFGEIDITSNTNLQKVGPNDYEVDYGQCYKIDRNKINLIGHNVLFDGKVLYDSNIKPRWDNDTMQMAFTLNPKVAKGKLNNKLKGITRRLFNHETPELSDLLGKGNEDKYRYLKDKRVAVIYGCADADYTRLVFKALRKMMPDDLYDIYREQDMEMLNALYPSEYYGLRIDEDAVKELAEKAHDDLDDIHEYLKSYIGGLVDKRNALYNLQTQLKLGIINEAGFKNGILTYRTPADCKYEFDFKPEQIRKILFEMLNYPVITVGDNNKPKLDKLVRKKLMSVKLEQPSNEMKEDLKSRDGKRTLIEAKEFNKYKYPIAYVLGLHATLKKEYDSYFKPIVTTNLEGRLFKGYSLSRIETYRIMNPSQTMKGELKQLVLPHDGGKEFYLVDFDMAQVEYRIMVSIAKLQSMIDRLKDPEKDFHTESAANIYNIPAHTVSKKLRKGCKSINFGIPYGLGDHSLCENIHGHVNERTMYETRKLMEAFKTRNKEVIDMLEYHRDEALKPRPFSEEFKDFCGYYEDVETEFGTERVYKEVGWVKNELGRYRLFDLSDLDKRKIGTIRRAAGNFPIQSFAAELFRKILIRFKRRCEKEGITDKVIWHMLIHDELLISVHRSINPFYLYKLILEECMITLPGHTEYFVGINVGETWADAKDDLAEAPVLFVHEMVKRWEDGEFTEDTWMDDPKAYVNVYLKDFIKRRIHTVIKGLQPSVDNEPIDFKTIDENLENYTVRAYIGDHFIPKMFINEKGKLDKDKWYGLNEDQQFLLCLCAWAYQMFGEDKYIKLPNGQLVNILMFGSNENEEKSLKFDILEIEDEIDGFDYLFDDETGDIIDDYDLELFFGKNSYDANTGEFKSMKIRKLEDLKYVKDTPRQHVITVKWTRDLLKVKNALKPHLSDEGKSVLFKTPNKTERWLKVSKDIDVFELDRLVSEVLN